MFDLTDDNRTKISEWMTKQDKIVADRQNREYAYYGAIGGAYTYSFTPTGLGVIVKVKNNFTGDELDMTDYNSW